MDMRSGYPDGHLFIGMDHTIAGDHLEFMVSAQVAAGWMAIAPADRRVWRMEMCEQVEMEFVPPGEPSIRERIERRDR